MRATANPVGSTRGLRRQLSLPEMLLWRLLRLDRCKLRFREQHPTGPYVADFYRPAAALLFLMALLAATPCGASGSLSDRDFEQLMGAAVAAASAPSEVQPRTTTVCVERALGPPFGSTKSWIRSFEETMRWRKAQGFEDPDEGPPQPRTGNVEVDKSITAAISAKAAVAHQTSISALPPRFVLVGKARPPECVVTHSLTRGPNWERDESVVVLSFTRPAFANGYAFLEEHEECAGLCGTTFLRAFRKRSGIWIQVASTILSVS